MNKELYQIWKRFVSLILSIICSTGLKSLQLAVVAYASTGASQREPGEWGQLEGTAYVWIGPRGGNRENPSTVHILASDLKVGLQAGQTEYSQRDYIFGWQGYALYTGG